MDKSIVYSYICELEKELKSVTINNRFSDLIVSEIINSSIIDLHEIDNSSQSDEKTAKGIVSLNIERFYSPKRLVQIEDKFWNWENRLQYGFRGRILATPENKIRFRTAVDTTRKEVVNECSAMKHVVSNYSFDKLQKQIHAPKLSNFKIWGVIAIVLLLIGGIWIYALNSRYQKMNNEIVFDKWTGNSIDVFERISE